MGIQKAKVLQKYFREGWYLEFRLIFMTYYLSHKNYTSYSYRLLTLKLEHLCYFLTLFDLLGTYVPWIGVVAFYGGATGKLVT